MGKHNLPLEDALRRLFWFVANSLILSVIVNVLVWWFYGTLTVTAQVDDIKNIEGAIVEIDGKYVGDTPVTTWIMPGPHTISVLVDGVDTTEAEVIWYAFVTPWGETLNAKFTTPR